MATQISPEYLARSGTEHGEQMALFCWAAQNRDQYPQLKWMYAIPNGGSRGQSQGAALKAEGVKSGVADICLPVQSKSAVGLYIEMKRANGIPSDFSKEQIDFALAVIKQAYAWVPCFGWKEAIIAVDSHLTGSPFSLSLNQQKVMDRVWINYGVPA